jgi:hypothetical protein
LREQNSSVQTSEIAARVMAFSALGAAAVLIGAIVVASVPIMARAQTQDADAKAAQAKAEAQRKVDEISEVARQMPGPAAKLECIWHGTRIVGLLWNDDIDAATRQLALYDRFNCPSSHIQAAFRCFLRRGPPDPKVKDNINVLALSCWANPDQSPPTAAATTP